jgi:hypothetical protein
MNAALRAAWLTNANIYFPAGLWNHRGLILPGAAADRGKAFRVHGQGCGEIFARALRGGTIFRNEADTPSLRYIPDKPNTGSGNVEIAHIRWEANSTTPTILLGSFLIQSEFHHNAIFQAGTGDGLVCQFASTSSIHHNYIINRDWAAANLGARRVGTGLFLWQTLSAGLTDIHNNTSRGFRTGYRFGDGSDRRLFSLRCSHNESSLNYDGIDLSASAQAALVEHCYFEGGDGGTAIRDDGRYNKVRDNLIFPGFAFGIDASRSAGGGSYTGNVLSAGNRAATVLARLPGGTEFRGNSLAFSGSGQNLRDVVGVELLAPDDQIFGLRENFFDPQAEWLGQGRTSKWDRHPTSPARSLS